jgi:hypothetical protein
MNCTVLRLLLVGGLLLVASQQMPAQRVCSNSDFFGPYAALGEGIVTIPPPPPNEPVIGPISRVGRVLASGDGQVGFTWTKGSYDGKIFDHTFGGTYSVNRDCTINILFLNPPDPFPPDIPLPFTGTIGDTNREIQLQTLAPGTVAPATLRKISIRNCSTADFAGSFIFDLRGYATRPPATWSAEAAEPRPGPLGRIGRLNADGQGNFVATAIANYAPLFLAEAFVGTYSVDSECKLVFRYTVTEALPAGIFNFPGAAAGPRYSGVMEGVMSDRSNAVVIQTSPLGAPVGGRLKKF